ncbi:putative transcription factor MYB-HB-like family [Helianthus debilis subsp. tardiflorus]
MGRIRDNIPCAEKATSIRFLGSPWTDDEDERFYKAYMQCEKDWKKVCAFFVLFFLWLNYSLKPTIHLHISGYVLHSCFYNKEV